MQDSFFPRAGFLNAPILYFMLKPPPGSHLANRGAACSIGGKAGYSAIHHDFGFERDLGVEFSAELARELAGQSFSVWRHELFFVGTLGF